MSMPQILYLCAVAVYVLFFLLFMRFFVWKHFADKNFWRRKPKLDIEKIRRMAADLGREVPFISVMVPARNEAEVIEKTVRHLSQMNYPKDRYELIVVTDQKEEAARDAEKPELVAETVNLLAGQNRQGQLKPKVRALSVAVLSAVCLNELGKSPRFREQLLEATGLDKAPEQVHEGVVYELALELLKSNGALNRRTIEHFFKHRFSAGVVRQVYPLYLSLAMPVVTSICRLRDDLNGKIVNRMLRYTAKASHQETREVLHTLTQAITDRLLSSVASMARRKKLAAFVEEVFNRCFPTTQEIVEGLAEQFQTDPSCPKLKHTAVPFDFDGSYPGQLTGHEVPSTKGRALNWGMRLISPDAEICGFYDAESRPDPDVLLYVAYRRLMDGEKVKILQGPVFQVRNFYQMSPFCKIASLYQAIAHDWYLPALFRRLPFVGGTNLYVDRAMLELMGGFDSRALTEDLEFGTRAYLAFDAWPEYLPYYSSEQTPPTVKAFFYQRLRWGTGHLQVMDKIRNDDSWEAAKRHRMLKELFIKGQLEWTLYQSATFVPPTVMILWWNRMIDPYVVSNNVRWLLSFFSAVYFGFTMYAYFRYRKYLDNSSQPEGLLGQLMVLLQLSLLPLAAFLFPVPYSSALLLKKLKREPKEWTKTPRTPE